MSTNGAIQLEALGDPTRRSIVERLAAGPSGVRQIADHLPVTRPAVSQHLKVLRDAGLVRVRAEGTRRIYSLDPTGPDVVRDYLDDLWGAALASFKLAAESTPRRAGDDGEEPIP